MSTGVLYENFRKLFCSLTVIPGSFVLGVWFSFIYNMSHLSTGLSEYVFSALASNINPGCQNLAADYHGCMISLPTLETTWELYANSPAADSGKDTESTEPPWLWLILFIRIYMCVCVCVCLCVYMLNRQTQCLYI